MITLDTGNNYDAEINDIYKKLYTVNSYLTALTQISSLTYLTSLSTLTSYASEINEIENSIFSLSTDLNNYLLSSETSSLTFNSSVLSLSDYLKVSETSNLTSPWDTISTSTLNNYLLSSETSSLTCEWKNIPTSTLNNYLLSSETSSLTFNSNDYVKTSDTGAFTSPWDTISTSTLNNYLLSSETSSLTFDSNVLSSYLLSSDYVSFDSSVLTDYLLTSDYVSFDSSVLNSYLLSSKTTDFAGSSVATLSTLSSLSSLSTLSNTPYMIDAEITNTNSYLYNVSSMSNFNPGTIMGNYSMGYRVEQELNSNWMNSYDHLLSFNSLYSCKFSFATSDSVSHLVSTDRRIGFTANSFNDNSLTHFDSLSGKNFSTNRLSYITHMTGDYAIENLVNYATEIKLYNDFTNTYYYVDSLSVYHGYSCKYSGIKNYDGMNADYCTFYYCGDIDIHAKAYKCSFTDSIGNLFINSASSCSGYVINCTMYSAEKNYLTANSFTIGSASSCTFQTCDSIFFNALYAPQMWAPHYVKGGTISGGSVTGDNLIMDVNYLGGLYMGNVCRGTISFKTYGNMCTIASAAYPQDIVIIGNMHPNWYSSTTWYFYLSSDLKSSFTLHISNIQNIQLSYQTILISNYLCLDVLGPRGVFSYGSYSYASLANYCPTSRLSYNGVPWAAILH